MLLPFSINRIGILRAAEWLYGFTSFLNLIVTCLQWTGLSFTSLKTAVSKLLIHFLFLQAAPRCNRLSVSTSTTNRKMNTVVPSLTNVIIYPSHFMVPPADLSMSKGFKPSLQHWHKDITDMSTAVAISNWQFFQQTFRCVYHCRSLENSTPSKRTRTVACILYCQTLDEVTCAKYHLTKDAKITRIQHVTLESIKRRQQPISPVWDTVNHFASSFYLQTPPEQYLWKKK